MLEIYYAARRAIKRIPDKEKIWEGI